MTLRLLLITTPAAVSADELIDPGIYAAKPEASVRTADVRPVDDAAQVFAVRLPEGWIDLRRGMSRGEAVALVGEPRWLEKTLAFDFWMYQRESIMAAGVLVFDGDRLSSWRPPDGPLVRAR